MNNNYYSETFNPENENMNMNGSPKPKKHSFVKFFVTIIIVGIILIVTGAIWFDKTKEKYAEEKESFTKNFDCINIDNLDFSTGVGRIYVKSTDDNVITVEATDVPKDYYKFSTKGNTFSIDTTNESTQKHIVNLMNSDDYFKNTKLTIYIPKGEYEYLKVNSGVGETYINEINCKRADLQQGVGLCRYDNLTVNGNTKLDCGVGETYFKNCTLEDTDIGCGIGMLDFNAELNGNLKVDGGIGDAYIDINGSYSNYVIDNHDNNIQISKGDNVETDSDKHYKIDVDKGIGSIKLKFR